MLTVMDAVNLLEDYGATDLLRDRGEVAGDDERALVDLFVDQIKFEDVIILNNMDTASSEYQEAARQIIRSLSADAVLIETSQRQVSLDQVLNARRSLHALAL